MSLYSLSMRFDEEVWRRRTSEVFLAASAFCLESQTPCCIVGSVSGTIAMFKVVVSGL
jgi:hypothetical protein